jgi:putative nucleotidyltransferase with HDIG domain
MFISGLDRPWLETPFITQGFIVRDLDDIEKLRKYCEFVYVDSRKSERGVTLLERPQSKERPRIPLKQIFQGRTLKPYQDGQSWSEERPRAARVLDTLLVDITAIFDHVSDGGKLQVMKLKKSVNPIVDSISRNPDACLWLTRLKQHDHYSYQHSLSVAIWAVAMGRELGLHKPDLRSLAIGGLLMDVGKLKVDSELLRAEGPLSPEQTDQMRQHVHYGVEYLQETGILNQDVIDMVAHHHERYDGSGYPQGLGGDNIPPFARIAAIVDTYDAMTSQRSHAAAVSPSEAIRILYKSRDILFQAELVEAFIKAVGIYPAGTLVELTSGEVGVVVAESRTRRLLPKVMLVLDSEKNELEQPQILDLLEAHKGECPGATGIARSLEPGAHGIDISEYKVL